MLDGAEPLRLEAWSRVNAVLMLGGFCVVLAIGRPWPASVIALLSFGALLAHGRKVWAAQLRAVLPNAVTALRVLVIAAVGIGLHRAPGLLVAALVLGVFALDAVDGWIARRAGTSSAFGAHFDMEADAFLILALDLELFARGQLGAWVLVPGLLRYSTVLCGAIVAPRAGDMPRSRFGSSACGLLVVGLMVAFVWPNAWGATAAAAGSALVTWSFARSFYDSYLRRPRAALTS
jgi:phosphatidylglycerophosphate synthase